LVGTALKHMTVTRYTQTVRINNHKWKSGSYGEFKCAQGASKFVGKVEALYKVCVQKLAPFPKVLQLLVVEPCHILGEEHGGLTLDLNLPLQKTQLVVPMKRVVCKIHVASHRSPEHEHLRTGLRIGNANS
jgi:hypothetical protein